MKKIVSILILFFMFIPLALAGVTVNSTVTPQTPNRGIVQFLDGTDAAGTYKTLYTAETTNGAASDIKGIMITSNDATAHLVTCQIVNATVKYGLFAVTTSTTTPGFATGVSAINGFSGITLPLDSNNSPYLRLVSGDTIQCTFATNLSGAGMVVNLVASAADY